MESLEQVSVKELKPSPFNPRSSFDEANLQELADSFESQGLIEPIIGRRMNGYVEIVAGERRWRAAKLAKLTTVPVIVKDYTDTQAAEAQIVENEQREDLDDLDRAAALKKLMDLDPKTYTVEYLAQRIGKKPGSVYLLLKLLDLIPEAAKQLREGKLSAGHGVLIARLAKDDQAAMLKWLKQREGWNQPASVRDLKDHIKRNVRIDTQSPLFAEEQPKVAAKLQALRDKGVVVRELARGYLSTQEGKAQGLIGQSDYREAGKKKCEHIQVGAYVLGGEDVQLTDVCTEKKCKAHWPELARERKAARQVSTARKETAAAKEKRLAAERRAKAARELQDRLEGVVIERIVLAASKVTRGVIEELAYDALTSYGMAASDELLKKIGLKPLKFDRSVDAAAKAFKGLSDKQLAQVAQLAALSSRMESGTTNLKAIAIAHGIDLKKLDAELAGGDVAAAKVGKKKAAPKKK